MSLFIAPAISPIPLPTETSSPSAPPIETQQPTIEPTQTAKPTPIGDAFYGPSLLLLTIGTVTVVVAAIAGILVYFKKRNPHIK